MLLDIQSLESYSFISCLVFLFCFFLGVLGRRVNLVFVILYWAEVEVRTVDAYFNICYSGSHDRVKNMGEKKEVYPLLNQMVKFRDDIIF